MSRQSKTDVNAWGFEATLLKPFLLCKPHIIVTQDLLWFPKVLDPFRQDNLQSSFSSDGVLARAKFDKSCQAIHNSQDIVEIVDLIHLDKVHKNDVIADLWYG